MGVNLRGEQLPEGIVATYVLDDGREQRFQCHRCIEPGCGRPATWAKNGTRRNLIAAARAGDFERIHAIDGTRWCDLHHPFWTDRQMKGTNP